MPLAHLYNKTGRVYIYIKDNFDMQFNQRSPNMHLFIQKKNVNRNLLRNKATILIVTPLPHQHLANS